MLDLSSWTVEVGALTSLYTVGLLPLTGPTSSWVGFCTQPTAVCAAILISPGPGGDILRGLPKSFHSRTRVNAFAGASRDMFRTLHLNPPHAHAWPAAAPHRTRLPVSRIGARAPLTAQGTDIGAKSGSAAAHDCSEPPPGTTEAAFDRSEEHTSELQSLMRISYAVFCLKNKQPQRRKTRLN